MIKFFRKIRQRLLTENKFSKYLLYALGEILLVVIGILIALQINNWNEQRKAENEEREILKKLQLNLRDDVKILEYQLDFKKSMIDSYKQCLDILSEKTVSTKEEFMRHFSSILQVGAVKLNMTTFNNLQTTGEIRLITSDELADNIVSYYNTDYLLWQSALEDYTRNITAPFVLQYDYIPQISFNDSQGNQIAMYGQPEDFKKPERTLDDYKNNYFIINTLRQKKYNLDALMPRYEELLKSALKLDKNIQAYLESK
ncbi:DUF6090 family protein [Aegicerativicinus sediminis]|uniref:DUF6090 family protein n=1 Tax=Aegicerativicinus sediminis TaxID=2893202 RepID=UPI001E29E1B4|nr:DUF6090 family protein [Aegicerativicinus sediminis]